MAYKFAFADSTLVTTHTDMKLFRAWAQANLGNAVVIQGTQVLDENNDVLGKLTYFKATTTSDAPTFVQPDPEGASLDDVLASIDDLETDAELDDVRREGAAARAGIPMLDEHDNYHGPTQGGASLYVEGETETVSGRGMGVPETNFDNRRNRRNVAPRAPRMSHKDCGHAITGEAGKVARAECRARRRAADQAAA